VRAEVEQVTSARSEAEQARDKAFAEIDAEAAADTEARAALADRLPADLMALYEKVRAASGGVGAAMLRQRRCEGCRLELMGAELRAAQAAPPDEVLRCENCRRILVRTTESGL
jgi:predicted  nucleic acid-binding Zn-ribbon protein